MAGHFRSLKGASLQEDPSPLQPSPPSGGWREVRSFWSYSRVLKLKEIVSNRSKLSSSRSQRGLQVQGPELLTLAILTATRCTYTDILHLMMECILSLKPDSLPKTRAGEFCRAKDTLGRQRTLETKPNNLCGNTSLDKELLSPCTGDGFLKI